MCYQYEAHKVYFNYACVKYDVIMPWWMKPTSPTIKYTGAIKGILGLKYQFIFLFIFNKFCFNLYLLRKSYSLFHNV